MARRILLAYKTYHKIGEAQKWKRLGNLPQWDRVSAKKQEKSEVQYERKNNNEKVRARKWKRVRTTKTKSLKLKMDITNDYTQKAKDNEEVRRGNLPLFDADIVKQIYL